MPDPRPTAPPPVTLDAVALTYPGGVDALAGLDLSVAPGSFTAIIGPNGCGKSTLLRLVAGLLAPTAGAVTVGDRAPRPGDAAISLAFQQPRLVPWLTVAQNVGLPLELGRRDAPARDGRVADALARVGLSGAAERLPHALSGGMAQRAALARALITDPGVLLLDEPFSALDVLTREAFDAELERLWLGRRPTVLLVTHSVSEALTLADEVVVLSARPGRVVLRVPVALPRPRDAELLASPEAARLGADIRAALRASRPPELAAWVGS